MIIKSITFLATLLVGLSVLFFSITNSLSHNVFTISDEVRNQVKLFLPQEWGFYSKNPRELELGYVEDGGRKLNYPNAKLSNIWGINRTARAEGTEAGLIYKELVSSIEMKPTQMLLNDLKKATKEEPYIKLKNKDTVKTMKGKYIFFNGEIVPFAWAKNIEDKFIVKEYIKVEIE